MSTLKVLALDGGGIRGIFSARFLEKFCNKANIDPSRLFDYFDVIIGTSIGGIQSVAYADGKTPAYMQNIFRTKGNLIFEDRSILPAYKERVVMGLSSDTTFYDNVQLRQVITDVIGNKTMQDLQGNVVLTAWNMSNNKPVLFSNIKGYEDYLTGETLPIVDCALATSAAPLYFPRAVINESEYIDGGVIQNNPALVGFQIGKRVFPTRARICVLSVGTCSPYPNQGRVFADEINDTNTNTTTDVPSNVEYLMYLLDNVFMGGVQKLVDETVEFIASNIYQNYHYYRFDYQFPQGQDAPMDNSSSAYLDDLVAKADAKFTAEEDKIDNFIQHFNLAT